MIKKMVVALVLCLFFTPLSRYVSPATIVDGYTIYLAYLPLSFVMAMIFIFGRLVVIPVMAGLFIAFSFVMDFPAFPLAVFVFCLVFPPLVCCSVTKYYLGARWRFIFPDKGIGLRIFWLGFVAPFSIKILMYAMGQLIDFPPAVANYFGGTSAIYMIIDTQNLVTASLIFTSLFYYPLRMLLNPRFAVSFWRRGILFYTKSDRRLYTLGWVTLWAAMLVVLCSPWHSELISSYLVPVIFIMFTLGIRRLGAHFIAFMWGITAWLLLTFNSGFLLEINTQYMLSFILSVFISFTVCILYMTGTWHKNEWMTRVYHQQAHTDPLTQLPNLRALEQHIRRYPAGALCCLRMENLEFLSRHYGMMMRVHCKKSITRELQPWLNEGEQIFQLPGCELLLFLRGGETEARLTHMVDRLNNKKLIWHNAQLEIEYGASWGIIDSPDELHPTLGQLSYLAEQACSVHRVLGLNSQIEAVSGQTTERVLLLQKIKRALDDDAFQLYAQPIVDHEGKGYCEILSRLVVDGQMITPDKFIPIIAEFNLSLRFDMMIMTKMLTWLAAEEHKTDQARLSVNLMPLTLMEKDIARRIVSLFATYQVSPGSVIIEVTEEQAFSDSEAPIQNILVLRENGFKIAIDDFGTGHANYERLKRLQADIIKIDGCFIRDIVSNSLDVMIVKSICELAQAKSQVVVAEYVETEEQRSLLLRLGVQFLQGYLTGKPEPLENFGA